MGPCWAYPPRVRQRLQHVKKYLKDICQVVPVRLPQPRDDGGNVYKLTALITGGGGNSSTTIRMTKQEPTGHRQLPG